MFSKILIANRGEIACRVMRTARRMGIATVAVYSEADTSALHVEQADEAVCIGPAAAAQSYLRIDGIIEACKRTGAEAVHPGYGFLSENAAFADALEAQGIVLIGPPAASMTAMGDKIAAKQCAVEAGVSVIPGSGEVIQNGEHAVELAAQIGYPVMLKASAGGGGKGMRIVCDAAECRDGFGRAVSEAEASFGDARVFVERFIEQPRHIEIQVLADSYGNVVHLGERECSIQRRHQKIIEEAPSPFIDDATREAMGAQAIALARAAGYRSAGTVEFIVDAARNFYFLEMNTRLQVEHPVTEMVTGLDLVELMIRVAAGEELPLTQEEIAAKGWAIEARVYAEDPLRGFLPSTGRLVRFSPPEEGDHVRVDTGVREGGEVSMHYDPMIAKLVTYGADRVDAIARMRAALDAFHIHGVAHNLVFLASVMAQARFAQGRLSTAFIDDEYPDGFAVGELPPDTPDVLAAAAIECHCIETVCAGKISGRLADASIAVDGEWVLVAGERRVSVRSQTVPGGRNTTVEGRAHEVQCAWSPGDRLLRARIDGDEVCVQVERAGSGWRLTHAGCQVDCMVLRPRAAELHALMPVKAPPDLSRFLLSPMPGLLVQVMVGAGDPVKAGQALAIVEAMKMENTLHAADEHTVKAVLASPGDTLGVDQAIIEFE